MSRYSRTRGNDFTFPIVILVGAAAWMHRDELVHIAYISAGAMGCLLVAYIAWRYLVNRHADLMDIDSMDGIAFERYVADLLRNNGYHNISLTERYDYGVDIIAEKDGIRWGVQVKRYSGPVKADAVRQVIAGLRVYGCDRGMVITNSTYSEFAKRLAAVNDCILIDRKGLKQLERSAINFNRGVIL